MIHRIGGRGAGARGPLPALLLLLVGVAGAPAAAQQVRPEMATCVECHRGLESSRAAALDHAKGQQGSCLTCHHVGFASDRATAVARRQEACRSCHTAMKPAHAQVTRGAPGCTSCHAIHEDSRTPVAVAASKRCESCHTTPHPLHAAADRAAGAASTIGVSGKAAGTARTGVFRKAAGATRAPLCTDCHSAHVDRPGRATSAEASQKCASCHTDAHPSHAGKTNFAASCTSCHSVKSRTVVARAQLADNCVACHKAVAPAHAGVKVAVVAQGAAGAQAGGSPTCTDCHAFGRERPLAQASAGMSERCGSCHKGAMKAYRSGAHSKGLATGSGDLPTCVSCHAVHGTHATEAAAVRVAATTRCLQCHSDERIARKYGLASTVGESYLQDYHGATLSFASKSSARGQPAVLACSDCHGPHSVARNDKLAVAGVCLRCHKEGDAKLAGAWLGHAPASASNRPLVWLARLFYYFLIPFQLIGLTLNILFHLIDQRRKGARPLQTYGIKRLRARLRGKKLPPAPSVVRFSVLERIEHLGAMSTFILLGLTGLPQTRPEWSFCAGIINALGGIATTRLVHRITGGVFVGLMVLHVARAITRALQNRRMPVMVPRKQDFVDAANTLRHYLGGTPRPLSGKFDATEKFEYWGLFLGGTLMSATGLALIFPELVTRLVPGQLLAMLRVMHGFEAAFAVSVIVLWHSYGVILRPEVFPLDTSIFTGRMTLERLEEEHGLEYQRLFPEGEATETEAKQDRDAEILAALGATGD